MVNFLRMSRQISVIESYITIKTPRPMPFDQAADWAEKELPGWQAICGCYTNPDE